MTVFWGDNAGEMQFQDLLLVFFIKKLNIALNTNVNIPRQEWNSWSVSLKKYHFQDNFIKILHLNDYI